MAYPEYYQSSKGGGGGGKGEKEKSNSRHQSPSKNPQQQQQQQQTDAGSAAEKENSLSADRMGAAGSHDGQLLNGPIPDGFAPLAGAGEGRGDGGVYNERRGSGGGGGMGGGYGDESMGRAVGAGKGGRNLAAELAAAEAAIEELQRDSVQYQLNSRNLSREVESLRAQLAEAIMQVRGRGAGHTEREAWLDPAAERSCRWDSHCLSGTWEMDGLTGNRPGAHLKHV